MGLFKRTLLLQDDKTPSEDGELFEPAEVEIKATPVTRWRALVLFRRGGKYQTSYQWEFLPKEGENSEQLKGRALAFAAELVGDGTGIFSDNGMFVNRQHIIYVDVNEYKH